MVRSNKKIITIFLLPEEEKLIKENAQEKSLAVSSYCRTTLLEIAKRKKMEASEI